MGAFPTVVSPQKKMELVCRIAYLGRTFIKLAKSIAQNQVLYYQIEMDIKSLYALEKHGCKGKTQSA